MDQWRIEGNPTSKSRKKIGESICRLKIDRWFAAWQVVREWGRSGPVTRRRRRQDLVSIAGYWRGGKTNEASAEPTAHRSSVCAAAHISSLLDGKGRSEHIWESRFNARAKVVGRYLVTRKVQFSLSFGLSSGTNHKISFPIELAMEGANLFEFLSFLPGPWAICMRCLNAKPNKMRH